MCLVALVSKVDLDKPIALYGVVPQANWSRNAAGVNYFPMVTTRHLLGQTTGVGMYPPGSKFTYDSDAYLQHLSQWWHNYVSRSPLPPLYIHQATALGIMEPTY